MVNEIESSEHKLPEGDRTIAVVAMPADTNPSGDIFGGWILSQMDIAGGVAANSELRERTKDYAVQSGVRAYVPSRSMCTDNAAMIATAAWWRLNADGPSGLDLGAKPNLKLNWIA